MSDVTVDDYDPSKYITLPESISSNMVIAGLLENLDSYCILEAKIAKEEMTDYSMGRMDALNSVSDQLEAIIEKIYKMEKGE